MVISDVRKIDVRLFDTNNVKVWNIEFSLVRHRTKENRSFLKLWKKNSRSQGTPPSYYSEITSAIIQEIYHSFGEYQQQISLSYWKLNFSLWRTFHLKQLAHFL